MTHLHGFKEILVGLGGAQLGDQQFQGIDRGQRGQDLAQDPDLVQLVLGHQQLFLAGRGAVDVDGREHAAVGQLALQVDLGVAGTFELFEDDVVHAAAGLNQRGGDDGQGAAFLYVAGRAEEALGPLEGGGFKTAGEHAAGRRGHGIVGAGEAGDRVEQDDHVLAVLGHALGFFEDDLGDLHVAVGRLVEGGGDDFAAHGALHVGDFLGPLVYEQHQQLDLGVVGGERVGDALQDHGLAGLGRGHDELALAFADGDDQVDHAAGHLVLGGFQQEALVGMQRGEVIEKRAVADLLYLETVDGLHLQQSEEPFAVLGRADKAVHRVAFAQAELLYLGRRDVNVFVAGKVVVFLGAEEAEAVRQYFQDAFALHYAVLLGLGFHQLADQLLLAQAGDALQLMLFGYLYKVGHGHFGEDRDVHFRQIRIRALGLVLILAVLILALVLVLVLALIGRPVVFHFLISPYFLLLAVIVSLSVPRSAVMRPVVIPVPAPAVLRLLRGYP